MLLRAFPQPSQPSRRVRAAQEEAGSALPAFSSTGWWGSIVVVISTQLLLVPFVGLGRKCLKSNLLLHFTVLDEPCYFYLWVWSAWLPFIFIS